MAHPTLTFEKPTAAERFRVLPAGVTAREVVDAARGAGLAFIVGAARSWNRAELRSWLILDYEPAIAWSRPLERRAPLDLLAGLDDIEVALMVDEARARVTAMVHQAAVNWRAPSFARTMIDARLVLTVYDRSGQEGYAPAAHDDMRLKDRVAALFLADYLSRPSDYERIAACEACGEFVIGTRPQHASWCAEPPSASGIVERSRPSRRYGGRLTLRGVG